MNEGVVSQHHHGFEIDKELQVISWHGGEELIAQRLEVWKVGI